MFICEKNSSCIGCDYQYADKLEDIDEEFRDCGNLTEVTRVVHTKWIKNKAGLLCCDNCGAIRPYDISEFNPDNIEYWDCNYCPKCGAKAN